MRGGPSCDVTAALRAHKSKSTVACQPSARAPPWKPHTCWPSATKRPPPDAKRAASALKYMPPDGPKATVKWPSKEGQTGTTGRISSRGVRRSLGRMGWRNQTHILRINNGEEDYATMDVSGVAEEDLKRLAPSFIEQPKAPPSRKETALRGASRVTGPPRPGARRPHR